MKPNNHYIDRLQQVITYLRERYNKNIRIEDLEELSNFSYRNLQRTFKAYFKETIGVYVTRIKIENSAKKILFTKDSVKDIADQVGYSDVYAFSKAFKKHYGISPVAYRGKKEIIFKKDTKETEKQMPFFEDKIVETQQTQVIYKTFKGDYYSSDIEKTWDALLCEASEENINVKESTSFGVIWDEPTISENIVYNYDACIVVEDTKGIKNKKFKTKIIPPQKYAVFIHLGPYKTIANTYDKIFSNWLFATEKEISEQPFLEFYTINESHTTNEEEYQTEIHVPLKTG